MPEQPEVERAVRELRTHLVGRVLDRVEVRHPAVGRALDAPACTSLAGRTVTGVERRGKHQLLRLDDDRVLHVHFRMAGDWDIGRGDDPLPAHARLVLHLQDGGRVALVDPRALSAVAILPSIAAAPTLGPDADDPALTPALLRLSLARRRGPIKPVLLDQSVLAGVGNIYASEGLWHAGISPRAPANTLGVRRLAGLLAGVREALRLGAETQARYAESGAAAHLSVYGREGEPCRRCDTAIRRIVQAGRSTYYCPRCQRR